MIILEVQLGRDDDKKYSWPVYVAVERSRRRCPSYLAVVTATEEVAAWAGQTIVDGSLSVRSWVLGPGQIPLLTPEQSTDEPELAMVSVLAHSESPLLRQAAEAALLGFRKLPVDRRKVYNEVIFAIFREACRKGLLEAQMLSQLMEKYRNEFQGFYDEGKTEGKAESILDILLDRGIAVPKEVREQVLACQDPALLRRWLRRALTVPAAEEIFQDN